MSKRLTRIAPWQAGKMFGLMYFFLSLIFVIPMALISSAIPNNVPGPHFGVGVFIAMPFVYAILGLLFVPIGCWFYNVAAKIVGGLEVSVTDHTDS